MTANGRVSIAISAAEEFLPARTVSADAVVRTIEDTGYSLLEIRIVMPENEADDLLLRMMFGDAEFSVRDISPLLPFDDE